MILFLFSYSWSRYIIMSDRNYTLYSYWLWSSLECQQNWKVNLFCLDSDFTKCKTVLQSRKLYLLQYQHSSVIRHCHDGVQFLSIFKIFVMSQWEKNLNLQFYHPLLSIHCYADYQLQGQQLFDAHLHDAESYQRLFSVFVFFQVIITHDFSTKIGHCSFVTITRHLKALHSSTYFYRRKILNLP